MASAFESQPIRRGQSTGSVDHYRQQIDAFQGLSDLFHHLPPKGGAGSMHSRRINQDDLRFRTIHDSENAISRGLRLRRDNSDFLADQPVYKCGLPGVGPPKNGNKTRMK